MLKNTLLIALLFTSNLCHAARLYIDNKTNTDIAMQLQFVSLDNPKMFNLVNVSIKAQETTATIRKPVNERLNKIKIGKAKNSNRSYTTIYSVTNQNSDYFTIVKPENGKYDVAEGRYTPCH